MSIISYDPILVFFQAEENNGVWLDYLLILPAKEYMDSLLNENRLDQTRQFIGECGSDYFSVNHTDEGRTIYSR